MSIESVYLFALPRVVWENDRNRYQIAIASFVRDALACERRMGKEVNLETEHERYTLICQRIEQTVLGAARQMRASNRQTFLKALEKGYFPAQSLYPGYVALLARTLSLNGKERLGKSFFPPDQVETHCRVFWRWATSEGLQETPVVKQRLAFFHMANHFDCGVIELQTAFHKSSPEQHKSVATYGYAPVPDEDQESTFIKIPDFVISGEALEPFRSRGSKAHQARILHNQIRRAIEGGEPVAFGNQAPHDVITEVLNGFVFVPTDEPVQAVDLRIIYADGSEAEPFPLFCLSRSKENLRKIRPIRAALMSMRHLEIDPEVDFYWFRNRAVSRTRTLAETDQFCYATTLEQFEESLALGNVNLHLYHTGFEPAVIGFYRGVTQTLLGNRKQGAEASLSVTPLYYRGTYYQTGSVWD